MTGDEPALDQILAEAVDLAVRGRFRVEPNPLVGAVVVSPGGEVVGRGFHAAYGDLHAEAAALADAGERARGATVVTTLEPCAHISKKTQPCCAALIRAGVARVVAGSPDPNPATSGRARDEFAAVGIAYEEGRLREQCDALITRYVAHLESAIPWTIAKWAMSADGRIADAGGNARWITGESERRLVHEIRGRVEAVVVGVGTVLADDPSLTCRVDGRLSPLRVVLDTSLRTPIDAKVVATAGETPTLIVCGEGADADRRAALEDLGVEVHVVAGEGSVDPVAVFRALHARGVRRGLLEAGGTVTAACLRAGVVRQVMAFTAPIVLGGERAPSPFTGAGYGIGDAPRLGEPRATAVGDSALLEGYWPR